MSIQKKKAEKASSFKGNKWMANLSFLRFDNCQMTVRWLPWESLDCLNIADDCLAPPWDLPGNWLAPAWWLPWWLPWQMPDDCLMTTYLRNDYLPDNCLTQDCLMTSWQLIDDCLTIAWFCLKTTYTQYGPIKNSRIKNQH